MTVVRGRRVLITGAGSGIGYECAHSFAKRGANLVLADINATALEKIRAEIAATGVQCFAQTCDVASAESVATFAAAVQRAVGPVDVLINNAGIAFMGRFEETPVAQWRRVFDVNVIGIVHCIQAFLPAMRAAGGPRKIERRVGGGVCAGPESFSLFSLETRRHRALRSAGPGTV